MPKAFIFTILLMAITFYFPLCSSGSSIRKSARDLRIRSDHPILFVDQELMERIRVKSDDLASFHSYVKSNFERNTDDPAETDLIREEVNRYTTDTHPGRYIHMGMYYGMDGYINESVLSKEYGKQYIIALLDIQPGIDDQAAGRAFALGVLYDWLYDYLDADLKERMRQGILERVAITASDKADVSGGHRLCWWDVYNLPGLLAIRYDIEQDDQEMQNTYFGYLDILVNKWRTKYNLAYQWIAQDSGYHMGWAYGQTYTTIIPYYIWEYATDEESWFSDWQRERVYWYLYGYRGKGWYDPFPYSGDVDNASVFL